MFWGAQKNRFNETVLLSTHNICFGREIRKFIFDYITFKIKGLVKGTDFHSTKWCRYSFISNNISMDLSYG